MPDMETNPTYEEMPVPNSSHHVNPNRRRLRARHDTTITLPKPKLLKGKATPQELDESNPNRTWYLPIGVVTNLRKPGFNNGK